MPSSAAVTGSVSSSVSSYDRKAGDGGGGAVSTTRGAIWRDMVKVGKAAQPGAFEKFVQNKYAMAVAVGVMSAFLLAVLNPPMVRQKASDSVTVPGRSVNKVLAWSALAAGATLALPAVLTWCCRGGTPPRGVASL